MAGTKTEKFKQAIIRYITDNGLKYGDKLPSQSELRLKFKIGSTTIENGLKELAEDKIIEVRDKVGVFIREGGLDGHTGRTVAILTNITNSIYTHIMISRLQERLQWENCRNLVFCCPEDKCSQRLKNYPGLLRSIMKNDISGILVTCELKEEEYKFLDKSGIKYVSTLFDRNGFNSCTIDGKKYMEDAMKLLISNGAKRPAVFTLGIDGHGIMPDTFGKILKKEFPDLSAQELIFTSSGFNHSRLIAEKLLSMPSSKRPDGFVFTGDLIMQGISGWLLLLQDGTANPYMPPTAVILNKQNPIFPIFKNVRIFELDIDEQAQFSVGILMESIRNNSLISSRKIPARIVSRDNFFENARIPKSVTE